MIKKILIFLLLPFLIISCKPGNKNKNGKFVDLQMKNLKQLTSDGDNGEAYFSWDNKKLIFQSNRGGYKCDKIWIMNIDGTEKKMVSPNHGAHTCSYFFPDNNNIIFASTSHLKGECPPRPKPIPGGRYMWPLFPYDIFKFDMQSKTLSRLTKNSLYDAEPIVSSDGKKIVFGSQQHGDFDIYIMNSDGSNQKRLTTRTGYDGGPWFSPDGKKIVWRAWHPGNKEEEKSWKDCMTKNYIVPFPLNIWVMNADGSEKKQLTNNKATNWSPSWHPDGKRIIFSSNMDDWHDKIKKYGHNFELYIMKIDGTGLTRLTYNKVFDSFPMFSHDGKKIVFASNRNPKKPRATDIFIADWVE